jgi:hypothetical protein
MAPNTIATDTGALATWIEPVAGSATSHRVRFASYSGGRWSDATTIVQSDAIVSNWADVPSVAEQGNGDLVAHWAKKSSTETHAYNVELARSTDAGRTWQPLGRAHRDASPTEHGFVSLTGERDRTAAIWLDGRETAHGGPTMLRAATITSNVGEETIVDDRVCDCCNTAAAMTDSGPIVVYRDRSDDEVRDAWIARYVDGKWVTHAVHSDGWKVAGCPVNGPSVAAKGHDVVVAWFTFADETARVRVAFSRDAGATFEPPIDVDVPRGTRAPVGRVDIVLDGNDAIASWLASNREAGQVLVRRIGRDRRMGPELEIARVAAGRDSGFPRLVRVADELLIMWTETTEPSRMRAQRVPIAAVLR